MVICRGASKLHLTSCKANKSFPRHFLNSFQSMQTNLPFGMYNGSTRHKSRKSYAHSVFENREWGSTLQSPARKSRTYTSTHTHTHTRARDPRTDTRSGLHSVFTFANYR